MKRNSPLERRGEDKRGGEGRVEEGKGVEGRAGRGEEGCRLVAQRPRGTAREAGGVLEGSGHQRGCSAVWDSEHTDHSTPAEEPPPYGLLRAAGQEGYSVLGAAQTPLLRRPGRAWGPPSARVPPSRSSEAFSPAPEGREQASPPCPLPAGRPGGPRSCNCTHCGPTGLEMHVALVPNGCQTLLSACDSLAIPSLPFCDQLALLAVLAFANSEASGSPPGPASWPLSCPGLCQQPWKLSITPVV